ncbi:MAG: 23S rRNA (adenine(2503)-C(2))-methyltransferase RlmN [Bacillota bacterium]
MQGKSDLRGMDIQEMERLVTGWGEKAYRGRQIFSWVHKKAVTYFREMSDLPQEFRNKLEKETMISKPEVLRHQVSARDDTAKYLMEFPDGTTVETVGMSYAGERSRNRRTVCVSSQVGCSMGCAFCATGLGGLVRNLLPGEIISQVLTVHADLLEEKLPGVDNVVFMGMGEPLLNYEAVIKTIRILHHPEGLNIGMRRIALSTCGIVPGIDRLAAEEIPIVLAISLHAANDALRNRLMPINRRYPLSSLLEACRRYVRATGRRVTFEYALIKGLNDSQQDVEALAVLVRGLQANINVIPVNAVPETGFIKPSRERVKTFVRQLRDQGVEAVAREERGTEIEAACGQLRRRFLQDTPEA